MNQFLASHRAKSASLPELGLAPQLQGSIIVYDITVWVSGFRV